MKIVASQSRVIKSVFNCLQPSHQGDPIGWTSMLVQLTGEWGMLACVCLNMLVMNTMLVYFCFSLFLPMSLAIRTLKDGPMIDKDGREYKSPVVIVDSEDGSEIQTNVFSPPVRVTCTPTLMIIQVKADVYGSIVSPDGIFLGGVEYSGFRQCQAQRTDDSEVVIKAGLQHCGTQLSVSDDSLIYSNQLTFSPAPRHGITRKTQMVVPVSCHYKKTHIVSSQARLPLQFVTASPKTSPFSLRLMSDNWTSQRLSNVFYLGDVLNLEASYTNYGPEQRWLFIDSCVATLNPEAASVPRYFFIENNGCLADSKQRGSRARFLSRVRPDLLQLQLDAFLFNGDERNTLFLTCRLKATSEMRRSKTVHKACTYMHSRWENIDGSPDVCRCCDTTCTQYSYKHLKPPGAKMCDVIVLGPLVILTKNVGKQQASGPSSAATNQLQQLGLQLHD